MDEQQLGTLVDYVDKAQTEKYEIDKITKTHCPGLTIPQAYRAQEMLVARRLARGETIAGPKLGLTSRAKMQQMHVEQPIYGYVFSSMLVENGGGIHLADYIHPKVEPEIGFVLGEDLKGPGVTAEDVLAATAQLFPAAEIIDSRYKNFDFTLPDVIVDNTSAAGAVFGTYVPVPAGVNIAAIEAVLTINGEEKARGTGAAVLEHPANAIAFLANMLAEKGQAVKAGQPIMTGGMTAAVRLAAGDVVEVRFDSGLGSLRFAVED